MRQSYYSNSRRERGLKAHSTGQNISAEIWQDLLQEIAREGEGRRRKISMQSLFLDWLLSAVKRERGSKDCKTERKSHLEQKIGFYLFLFPFRPLDTYK